jgi:putative FmdB family regulatory protein
MPLYEFVCRDCETEQEILIRGSETPVCSSCGGVRLVKLLSVPVAHLPGSSPASRPGPAGGSCGSGCGCHPH